MKEGDKDGSARDRGGRSVLGVSYFDQFAWLLIRRRLHHKHLGGPMELTGPAP
jgi:hypothetical protein